MPLSLINPLTEASTIATNVVNNSAQTNYLTFPVATSDPTSNGWRVYADSAATSPVDGTGGSPNTTLTQNTSSPLSSTGDFRLTKSSGESRQGEGISTDFTIANRHLGKVLQISFDYELVSGALATDDLRIYIIQGPGVTNTVIEPVNVGIQGTMSGTRLRHLATFQTDISVTSYRLCVHIKTTTNSAQTIDFNNFRVWETTQSIGSITTDWTSYTPTFTNLTISTYHRWEWRRVGSILEIRGTATTNNNPGGGQSFTLPSGFTANVASSNSLVGYAARGVSTESNSSFIYTSNGSGTLFFGQYLGATGNNPLSNGNLMGSNELLSVQAFVPIQGWGSSVSMSSDSGDGRIVSGSYQGHTSKTYSVGDKIKFNTLLYDSHNIYNLSTGDITIPISGTYFFNLARIFTTGSSISFSFFKGGNDTTIYALDASSSLGLNYGVQLDNLKAGDIISIRSNGTGTTIGTISGCIISWFRINSGSQVISTAETVACSVNKTSGTASTPNRITSWNTKDLDTHGSFDLTNGTFTVPMSGVYLINASAISLGNFTTYNQPGFTIRVGTTILSASTMYFTSSFEPELSTSALRRFVAGDIISLYGYGSGFSCGNLTMNISRIGT